MDITVAMRKALSNDFGVKTGKMYKVRETRQVLETVIGARVQINGTVYIGSLIIGRICQHNPLGMRDIRAQLSAYSAQLSA